MANVYKKGFCFWKKTVVEYNGNIDEYSGNAIVEQNDGSVCVTEKGLIHERSSCYLESNGTSSSKEQFPDGELVSKSKSIAIETSDGDRKVYDSSILAINSMEKSGDQVNIVKNGIFGKEVIDTIDANQISKIESENCNVCKATNPVYKD